MIFYMCYFNKVEPFEILRETEHCVFYKTKSGREVRENKVNDYKSYHKTREEAYAFLINEQKAKIKMLEDRIKNHIEEINKITKDKEASE